MKYLLGLVIIGSYFFIAIFTILAVFIISNHKFRENQIAKSIILLVIKLFAIGMVVFIIVLCLSYGCNKGDPPVKKPLQIKMVNDKPCFYIEPFEDMDRFVIRNLTVDHTIPSLSSQNQWHEGDFDTMGSHTYYRPIGNRYLFAPSAMAGSDKCVEYGTDLDNNTSIVQELKTGALYCANCDGYNKKQWMSWKENIDRINLFTCFYLRKNEQTGKLEAVVVKDDDKTIK